MGIMETLPWRQGRAGRVCVLELGVAGQSRTHPAVTAGERAFLADGCTVLRVTVLMYSFILF